MANFRDHQQQPFAAQDLPHPDIQAAPSKLSVPFTLCPAAPPLLYFLVNLIQA